MGTASPSAPTLLPAATLRAVEPASERDCEAIERQLGRPPRALAGVAARCAHGGPACSPSGPTTSTARRFRRRCGSSCRALVARDRPARERAAASPPERELAARLGLAAEPAPRRGARGRAARRAWTRAAARADDGAALGDQPRAAELPAAPLKCLHAHAAAALASRPTPSAASCWSAPAPRFRSAAARGRERAQRGLAREDWRAGERAVERVLADPARAATLDRVMLEIRSASCAAASGNVLAGRAPDVYDDADRWARDSGAASRARARRGPRTGRRRRPCLRRGPRAPHATGRRMSTPPPAVPPASTHTDELQRIERRRKAAVRQRRHSRLRKLLVLLLLAGAPSAASSSGERSRKHPGRRSRQPTPACSGSP